MPTEQVEKALEGADVVLFHQSGRDKWQELGIDYKLKDTEPPSDDVIEQAVSVFRAAGLQAF